MKKILVTMLSLVAGAAFVHAQGLISIAGRPVGSVQTNTSSFLNQGSGTVIRGAIPTQPQAGAVYDFALLIATTTTAGDSTPLGADWSQAQISGGGGAFITASNSVNLAGGVSGTGGTPGVGVTGWAPGAAMNIMLVGWSAGLGSSWAQVAPLLAASFAGNSILNQYFGYSGIANIASGGVGSPASPATSIFGAGIQGFDLFAVPVPEPTTLALAGLGGLSMLFLRRRKA